MSQTAQTPSQWPGERLGLPQTGPRSVGRPGRRFVAIGIDWACAIVISIAFFQYDSWATLGIFAVAQIIFLVTVGGSVGHMIMGMRLVPIRGGRLGIWQPIVRTILLCLVVPAVIWDSDQRGMHDRLVGTVLVMIR